MQKNVAYVGVDYLICIQNLYNSKKKQLFYSFLNCLIPFNEIKKKTGKQYFVADLRQVFATDTLFIKICSNI